MQLSTRFMIPVVLGLAVPSLYGAETPTDKAVKVVTTLPHLAAIAREVGGERVSVTSLTTGRLDPHFIQPTPKLMRELQAADLFVENGLSLEPWSERVIDGSRNPRVRVLQPGHVYASKGIVALEVPILVTRAQGDLHAQGNPHIWLDPLRAKQMAANIVEGLKRVDPDHANDYAVRLLAFERRVDEALFGDELVALFGGKALSAMAQKGRLFSFLEKKTYKGKPLIDRLGGWLGRAQVLRGKKIVFYHRSWIYFTTRFGLNIAGYVEEKPGIPASARHRAHLTQLINKEGIQVVALASFYSEKLTQQVVSDTQAKVIVLPLDVGGAEGADDYFSLMDTILNRLVQGFEE